MRNVALDPRQRFLVEFAGTFWRCHLGGVDAPIIDTGQPGFDLALPLLGLRIALPVLVVQPVLVARPRRDTERVQRRGGLAQRLFNRRAAGICTQLAGLLIAGPNRARNGVIHAIGRAVHGCLALPVASAELPFDPGLVDLVVDLPVVQQIGALVERLAHQQRIGCHQRRWRKAGGAHQVGGGRSTQPAARVAGQCMVDLRLCSGGVALLQQFGGATGGDDSIGAGGQQTARAHQRAG
ncbi:hypothetical protein D3C71_1441050 [compost metagenome]